MPHFPQLTILSPQLNFLILIMNATKSIPTILFFVAMLVAMDQFLGHRTAVFTACFSGLWFVIAFVLLTRPPAIPEFKSQAPSPLDTWGDDHIVIRRDLIPQLSLPERLRLSLTVACGACLLIWLTLTMLAK